MRRAFAPYLLILPGGVWLGIFFLIPLVYMASASLMTGSPEAGYRLTWHFANYVDVFSLYKVQFLHSIVYAGIATIITLVVGFPVAYWIAFYGGRRKNFFEVVEDLVQRNLVVRQTTTKRRVFILRAVSPKHPLYGKRIEIQEPLQPEAA